MNMKNLYKGIVSIIVIEAIIIMAVPASAITQIGASSSAPAVITPREYIWMDLTDISRSISKSTPLTLNALGSKLSFILVQVELNSENCHHREIRRKLRYGGRAQSPERGNIQRHQLHRQLG